MVDFVEQLPTPALVVDKVAFDANVAMMTATHPGRSLRPHVKAFKSTALARQLAARGHLGFCAATVREVVGMVEAGVGDEWLLANEVLDYSPLGHLVERGASIIAAVDSDEVLDAVVRGGVRQVLIDVEVGLPRCGCDVGEAGRLADTARSHGLDVRGVMGYEGHLMMVERPEEKAAKVEAAMAVLLKAHNDVGGDIISGGGTGTYHVNTWVNEIQAGSYCLMDTDYAKLGLPFAPALRVLSTIVSVSVKGWAVGDAGLKAFAMDHGTPSWDDGDVWFCSDEHITVAAADRSLRVGDTIWLTPAHVDPTVAKHDTMWVVEGDKVIDQWPVDLRGW